MITHPFRSAFSLIVGRVFSPESQELQLDKTRDLPPEAFDGNHLMVCLDGFRDSADVKMGIANLAHFCVEKKVLVTAITTADCFIWKGQEIDNCLRNKIILRFDTIK